MKYAKLPGPDHIVRQIPPSRLIPNDDGEIVGIFPEAFEKIQPDGLSVTWLEFWPGDEFQRPFAAKAATEVARPSKNAGYACANVAVVLETIEKAGQTGRVLHDPMPNNQGHALVKIPTADPELFDKLAREVFVLERVFLKK
ncbi:MAG: hypothetical protein ING19_02725 [Azospirillum sp.]|nr:hypothetical protein [Azospirillum sp.]